MFGKKPTALWVCCKFTGTKRCPGAFEFVGVFDSEEKAVAACATPDYFIGPATLNEATPDKTTEWPGAYYPREKST